MTADKWEQVEAALRNRWCTTQTWEEAPKALASLRVENEQLRAALATIERGDDGIGSIRGNESLVARRALAPVEEVSE